MIDDIFASLDDVQDLVGCMGEADYAELMGAASEAPGVATMLRASLLLWSVLLDGALSQADRGALAPDDYHTVMQTLLDLERLGTMAGTRLTRYAELAEAFPRTPPSETD